MYEPWGGSCFGMSAVLSLVRAGDLDVGYFQSNASNLHDLYPPKDSQTVNNLINYYHLIQVTTRTGAARGNYNRSNETSNNRAVINALNNSAYPVVVGLDIYNAAGIKIGGHAVVAYGYERTSSGYSVFIWDPNDAEERNILRISSDFSTSEFDRDYDTGYYSSYIKYSLTVEQGDYDYKNIQDELISSGNSSGAAGISLMSMRMAGEEAFLHTNYDSFTITCTAGLTATIKNGQVIDGDLDISDADYLNEPGDELNLEFTITGWDTNNSAIYSITPDTTIILDEYKTVVTCNDSIEGFYSGLTADNKGTVEISGDGTLTTAYTVPTRQRITVAANDSTTSWYAVTVESDSTGLTVSPQASSTAISSIDGATVTVEARDDYNALVFETYTLDSAGVSLTEDPASPGTGILGTVTETMGHSLIFYTLGGTPIAAQTNIRVGYTATRPADPVRGGFTFAGWYTTPSCDDGSEWSFDTPITRDTRIFAKWLVDERYNHTVTFRAEGHDDIIFIIPNGGSLTADQIPPVPEKSGYHGMWDITDFSSITSSIIVNAIYASDVVNVTVTYTDGLDYVEAFPDQVYTVPVGSATPAFSGTPTMPGYVFTGWSPAVTETVTGETVYVAQWSLDMDPEPSYWPAPTQRPTEKPTPTPTPTATPTPAPAPAPTPIPEPSQPTPSTPPINCNTPENGSVTVSDQDAKAGDTVTITLKADDGYVVDKVTVVDKAGNAVEVKKNEDGTYSFVMPEKSKQTVEVTVTFKEDDPDKDCPSEKFIDVDPTLWYHEGIDFAIRNGLMAGTGDNLFAPDLTTSRAMLVTVLYNLEGKPATGTSTFTDVPEDQWYAKAVAWAAENNIVAGYGNNLFGPNDPISREQMATMLYHYAQYKQYDVSKQDDLSAFSDADEVSSWALSAMRWAVAEGLIAGTSSTTLSPSTSSNRAMVATILKNFCENIVE